ncbi:MAG: PhoH family protein [bacterium]
MSQSVEQVIALDQKELLSFCGRDDRNLREIEARFPVRIVPRGNTLKIIGDPVEVEKATGFVKELIAVCEKTNEPLTAHQFRQALEVSRSEKRENLQELFLDRIPVPLKRRHLTPLTPTQKLYVDGIRKKDIVFGIGPAGTGKTYLAVAMAVSHLVAGSVSRIVLVRPAVEAGEKLGFLPGDISAKFDPFVRPLYDALYEMIEPEKINSYLENGIIEIAPLAFMRGRTLNNAFVILDEGQNTSVEQMKMFLTRLGFDSKAVITGDITQVDLPEGKISGLVHVQRVLGDVEGIAFIYFDEHDVVRHELVQKIILAYEKDSRTQQ